MPPRSVCLMADTAARRHWSWLTQHVALVLTLAFFATATVRVVSAARGSLPTAGVLLATNPAQVGSFVLVEMMPVLLLFASAAITFLGANKDWSLRLLSVLGALVVLSLGLRSVPAAFYAGIVPAVVIALVPVEWFNRIPVVGRPFRSVDERSAEAGVHHDRAKEAVAAVKRGEITIDEAEAEVTDAVAAVAVVREALDQQRARALRAAAVMAVLVGGWLLWLVSEDRLWLPLETIEMSTDSVIGYVVAEGDWLTVVQQEDRSVVRIASERVTDRTVCVLDGRPPSWLTRPIATSLFDLPSPSYPVCVTTAP